MEKKYYIKTRINPQLGTYYVGEGLLSKTAAKKHERPLYGDNIMTPYDTEQLYNAELDRLRESGEAVH